MGHSNGVSIKAKRRHISSGDDEQPGPENPGEAILEGAYWLMSDSRERERKEHRKNGGRLRSII